MMEYFVSICIFLSILYVGLIMSLGEIRSELKKIRMILEREAERDGD